MWVRMVYKMNKGAIESMTQNLGGLVEALARRGLGEKGEEQELEGALVGVEKINLVAWRFFVKQWPFECQTVMLQVCIVAGNRPGLRLIVGGVWVSRGVGICKNIEWGR